MQLGNEKATLVMKSSNMHGTLSGLLLVVRVPSQASLFISELTHEEAQQHASQGPDQQPHEAEHHAPLVAPVVEEQAAKAVLDLHHQHLLLLALLPLGRSIRAMVPISSLSPAGVPLLPLLHQWCAGELEPPQLRHQRHQGRPSPCGQAWQQ